MNRLKVIHLGKTGDLPAGETGILKKQDV